MPRSPNASDVPPQPVGLVEMKASVPGKACRPEVRLHPPTQGLVWPQSVGLPWPGGSWSPPLSCGPLGTAASPERQRPRRADLPTGTDTCHPSPPGSGDLQGRASWGPPPRAPEEPAHGTLITAQGWHPCLPGLALAGEKKKRRKSYLC